jgi:D-glycero-D-manno-heptose 1,7-bisphosphate phosphatase
MTNAIFLDRDGIINQAIVYNNKPYPPACVAATKLVDGIKELCDYFIKKGFIIIGITNQPDVARKIQTWGEVQNINHYLMSKLPIQEIFTCFHDDDSNCQCRKPKPGLLIKAIEKYDVDIVTSWLIGDRKSDIDVGNKLILRTIFIDYGYDETKPTDADFTVNSVKEIINIFKKEFE